MGNSNDENDNPNSGFDIQDSEQASKTHPENTMIGQQITLSGHSKNGAVINNMAFIDEILRLIH